MTRTSTAFLALLLTAPPVLAAQDSSTVITKITADLGYVQTSGNTQVTTMNIGEKLTQERGRLTLKQGVALVYGKQRDSITTNSFRANVRGDFKLDQYFFTAFAGAGYDRDRFAGIAWRVEQLLGIGAQLLQAPRDTIRIEGGASLTQQRGTDGVERKFPSARLAGAFRHAFTPTAYFQQNVEYIPNMRDGEDFRVNSESAVIAPLSTRIGLKTSYTVRFDNLPEPGFATTDKLFTTGIQITF